MSGAEPWRQRLAELADAFALLTRLPVSSLPALPQAAPGASVWAYPVVGATVGALGGAVYWLVHALGCPAPLAALWALAVTILATGALHEDGLADAADGLAGDTPQQSLAIMRDHRIGTYGAIALLLALGIRATAVALLAEPGAVLAALIAAGAAGRASAVMLMAALPAARNDGLSAAVGRPGGTMTWGGGRDWARLCHRTSVSVLRGGPRRARSAPCSRACWWAAWHGQSSAARPATCWARACSANVSL